MADGSKIEDPSLAWDMAHAEKPIRDNALTEANAASNKVKRSYDEGRKIQEGFEGQVGILMGRMVSTQSVPKEIMPLLVLESRKDLLLKEQKVGEYFRLVGDMPYPDPETAKRQFSASLMHDLLKNMDNARVNVEEKVGSDGKTFEARSDMLDYVCIQFPDLPNVALNVGIVSPNNISTRKMNNWKQPTPDLIFDRQGSKVFMMDVVPVSPRQ